MKNKTLTLYKSMKNHKILSIALFLLVLISPIIVIELLYWIGDLLNDYSIKTAFQPTDILNYFGVILGGFVTFGALYFTIIFEKKERKEDRRLQIYPYLKYTIINKTEHITKNPYIDMDPIWPNLLIYEDNNTDCDFCLSIENIGKYPLTSLKIVKLKWFGEWFHSEDWLEDIVKVNETKYYNFTVQANPQEEFDKLYSDGLIITVVYYDIMNNSYKQNIKINIYTYVIDFDSLFRIYAADIPLKNISEPIILDKKN